MRAIADGTPMGCSDSGPPEDYSNYELSRALDFINCAVALQPYVLADDGRDLYEEAKKLLPAKMRFAMTWDKWRYEAVKP